MYTPVLEIWDHFAEERDANATFAAAAAMKMYWTRVVRFPTARARSAFFTSRMAQTAAENA